MARVRFIKSAQRLGFSLDEITERFKLASAREKFAELQRIESVLNQLMGRFAWAWGAMACPLIASMHI